MIFVLEDDPIRLEWFRRYWADIVHTDSPVEGMMLLRKHPNLEGIYLGHDLGGAPYTRGADGDGIDMAVAMANEGLHTKTSVVIHSLNITGSRNMEHALQRTHPKVHRIPFSLLKEIIEDQYSEIGEGKDALPPT
jgi:hypothetical protein